MSKPITVGPDTTLAEVGELLERTGFNAVPVISDGSALVGFVTSLDLLKAFSFGTETLLPQYDHIIRKHVSSVMQQVPNAVNPRNSRECSRGWWPRGTRASRSSTPTTAAWSESSRARM